MTLLLVLGNRVRKHIQHIHEVRRRRQPAPVQQHLRRRRAVEAAEDREVPYEEIVA